MHADSGCQLDQIMHILDRRPSGFLFAQSEQYGFDNGVLVYVDSRDPYY